VSARDVAGLQAEEASETDWEVPGGGGDDEGVADGGDGAAAAAAIPVAASLVVAVAACGRGSCEEEGLLVWALELVGRDWVELWQIVARGRRERCQWEEPALAGPGEGFGLYFHGSKGRLVRQLQLAVTTLTLTFSAPNTSPSVSVSFATTRPL
jgi:hypothetical protein